MTQEKLTEKDIKKFSLVKEFYYLAEEYFRRRDNIRSISIGVVLLQDAAELFLLAIFDYLSIPTKEGMKFHEYFDKIKDHIGSELPLRRAMIQVNKVRVNIKHHGLLPNVGDCLDYPIIVRNFFLEVSKRIFNIEFDSISLISIIQNEDLRKLLTQAETYLMAEKYEACLKECRKVMFLEFEKGYDIRRFESESDESPMFKAFMSSAPFYAKDKKYIQENVEEPTDYIVIDHSKFDQGLLVTGILPLDFWNIWRLTPKCYYYEERKSWVFKDDFAVDLYNKPNAEYCLLKTTEMILLRERHNALVRGIKSSIKAFVINEGSVKVYSKASRDSTVRSELDYSCGRVFCHYKVQGLDSDESFLAITCEYKSDGKNQLAHGFVAERDIATFDNTEIS